MVPTLYLGPINDHYRHGHDHVVAPRCFLDRESLCSDWDRLEFPDPFADPAVRQRESLRTRRLANHLLPDLAARMNVRHGTGYSLGYWRILLMPWLMNMVTVAWKRWLEMEATVARLGGMALRVPALDGAVDWDLVDDDEIWSRGLRLAEFDHWLTSVMALAQRPAGWEFSCRAPRVPPTERAPLTPPPAGLARWIADFKTLAAVPGATAVQRAVLALAIEAMRPFRRRGADVAKPCDPAPGRYRPGEVPDAFLAALDRVLVATLPRTYRDDFHALDHAARRWPIRRGRLRLVAASDIHHVPSGRFRLAHAFEAGEKLVCHQHGAGYGIYNAFFMAEMEYVHHGFLSWGWTSHAGHLDRALPLPSPRLSGLIGRRRGDDGRLILVGTEIAITCNRFNSEAEPSQLLHYRRMKADFAAGLDTALRAKLHYRPYVTQGTLEDATDLARRCGALPVVEGDLLEHLLGCRLAVLDHPGTTIPMAMVADVPVIGFWERAAWPFCPEADALLDELAEAGLWHPDGAAAAAHVNRIGGDVAGWWNSAPVVRARRRWLDAHGRADRHWLRPWLAALWRLNREPRRVPEQAGLIP